MRNLILCAMLPLLMAGCAKEPIEGNGSIRVNLTDAPAAYQHVNVDIQQVRVHLTDSSGNGNWINLPTNTGIYDLLALQNGIDTNIVSTTSLPAGTIDQIRLMLGASNSIMADSTIYNLKVPSGTQSGVKLNGSLAVVPNQTLQILLDFDAMESVVETGNGQYILKPVIKLIP